MRVVVAPDKFKGCLTAAQVAKALSAGLLDTSPDLRLTQLPVADGGDGTVSAALSVGYAPVAVDATGPTGEPVQTVYALDGSRAVVELADVVGLGRLPHGRTDPLGASTCGLGLVIKDAIARGANDIVLGIGGSASTDGGAGMAQALGARLLDAAGQELATGGAALVDLVRLDLTGLRQQLRGVRVVVACDVTNPLLGPRGAAAVFGPQKGADAHDTDLLEAGLTVWARVVADTLGIDLAGRPGAGAAGGTGFAALALLDAELRPGIDLVLGLLDFAGALAGADLVITGEGSLDEQSLAGKAPVGVAQAAARAGVPVVVVSGRNLLSAEQLREGGISQAYALNALEPDITASMANAAHLLRQVGATIAKDWLLGRLVDRPVDGSPPTSPLTTTRAGTHHDDNRRRRQRRL